jgi:hypothetical protein
MLDCSLQARFAKSCSDAAFGYANAATAAYANWASQAFEAMAGAMRGMEPAPAPRSWYREPPPAPQPIANGFPAPAAMSPFPSAWAPFAWPGLPVSPPSAAAMNPFTAWLDMMSFRGPPTAWPMAFMMVAVGVPRNVAWPTAEANAAAIEAVEIARKSLEDAFSTYRTDGGHANAQIKWGPEPRKEPASPPAAPLALWPWFAFPG